MSNFTLKILTVVAIQVIIALIHVFRLGQVFSGLAYNLYYGYFSDLVLPFGFYFLLTVNEASIPALKHWYVKAAIIFSLCAAAEFGQFLGFYVLGVTFDPVDILVYAAGVLIAALVDVKVFAAKLSFWKSGRSR
jgi:hypothetical protein